MVNAPRFITGSRKSPPFNLFLSDFFESKITTLLPEVTLGKGIKRRAFVIADVLGEPVELKQIEFLETLSRW